MHYLFLQYSFFYYLFQIWTSCSVAILSLILEVAGEMQKVTRGQFNKTFTSVIYKCSYCFRG